MYELPDVLVSNFVVENEGPGHGGFGRKLADEITLSKCISSSKLVFIGSAVSCRDISWRTYGHTNTVPHNITPFNSVETVRKLSRCCEQQFYRERK